MRIPLFLVVGLLLAHPAPAQVGAAAAAPWNDPRALELIGRAQERRAVVSVDTGLVNFQADARLYVYFYLDRPNSNERNLVQTDQLGLEVFWQAPDQVKQRIVGWRDKESLPTNINYHLDHLTVVLENFGDEIRIGDGDEVRGVPHPAAPGAANFYEYRLRDSLTLTLPGTSEPVRVYQIEVRPRDAATPAFVGSVYVDRRAGDIVRMDFTFTRTSYVDRYLDYINIQLDNGLWRGRFWLPNEQRVEIRRRVPGFDIPIGSVIRATMRVSNYRFNQPLPPLTFAGPRVVAVPRAQRDTFPFEQGLHDEVREEGIGPEVELSEIRRQAAQLIREEALRQATDFGLSLPAASELFRYNRAEGPVLSAGYGLGSLGPVRLRVEGGYAFGAERPQAAIEFTAGATGDGFSGSLYLNRPGEIGVTPVVSGAINTLSALLAGEDYLDLYRSSGGALGMQRPLGSGWSIRADARAETQDSPGQGTDFALFGGGFRPVFAIDEADLFVGGGLALLRRSLAETARSWGGELGLEVGLLNPIVSDACDIGEDGACIDRLQTSFVKPRLSVEVQRRWEPRETDLRFHALAGGGMGDLPLQELYFVGGRGTIPGYRFRSFAGDQFAVANAVLSADVSAPWVRGRLSGAIGWAGLSSFDEDALAPRLATPTDGVRSSVGIGLGLVHDILHIDLARGLASDGEWEVIIEANKAFWDFL